MPCRYGTQNYVFKRLREVRSGGGGYDIVDTVCQTRIWSPDYILNWSI